MQKEGKATTQEGNNTNVSSMRDECVQKVTPLGYLASCHYTSKKPVQVITLWAQKLFCSSHVDTCLPYEDTKSTNSNEF